jgi:secondary thiamine-phosphate synthase enzyme
MSNRFFQKEIALKSRRRGFHLVTDEIVSQLPELSEINTGIAHIFIKHTSASLTINENASPDVLTDMQAHFERMVPENSSYYRHDIEGSDDMPAHIKASMLDFALSIPVTNGRFNLGTWQGIYLCEHRNSGGSRKVVVTLMGEGESKSKRTFSR